MLGGGGGRDRPTDSGEYRMNDDGSVGYRRANQDSFITVSKTSPGAQRFMAGLTKGVSKVTNTIQDYVSTGGIIGSAIKNVFSGSKAATKEYDGSYNQMPAGFVDGGEPDKQPLDNRRPDNMGVADNRFSTFDQTADALTGGTVSYEKVYTGTAKQIQQKKGPFKMVPKVDTSLRKVYTGTKKQQLQKKGPYDFVTKTDKHVEKILIEELSKIKKNYSFITEETGVIKNDDKENIWIIDPIDGTTNFLHGIPHFAICIALQSKKEIVSGLIFDPIKDEMFFAEKDKGAFLNNQRLRVSKKNSIDECLFSSNHEGVKFSDLNMRYSGCAALDLAYVASGRLDGFFHNKINLWDVAAGEILVKEAGGIVNDIHKFDLNKIDIKASSAAINDKMLENLINF